MVLPAVVFNRLDAFSTEELDSPTALDNLPSLALDRLRAGTKGNTVVRSYMTTVFEYIMELLVWVDGGKNEMGGHQYEFFAVRNKLDEEWPWSHDNLSDNISSSEDAMMRSCLASLRMLRYLLDDRLPPQSDTLSRAMEEMGEHVAVSDPTTWLKYAPQANSWVIMLGLAASQDVQGRLWFLMNERCVLMSMKAIKPPIHRKFWSCYHWTKQLIHARSAMWTGPPLDATRQVPFSIMQSEHMIE
jgi:hypothetical protein